MAKQQSGYDVVIADLEAERDQLNSMIAVLKRRRAGGPVTSVATSASPQPIGGGALSSDAFFGMTLPDAGHKYLSMVKSPTPHAEFCDALLEGGFKTTASNFREVVRSTLSRHPDFVKVRRGQWGLKEWYNRSPRRSKRANAEEQSQSESNGPSEGADK